MTDIRKRIIIFLMALLIIIGCGCVFAPTIFTIIQQQKDKQAIKAFDKTAAIAQSDISTLNETDLSVTPSMPTIEYSDLLTAMEQYNTAIYQEGQSGLVDAWSYQQASFDLSEWGIDDNILGYIEIPSMDSILPIYLGATNENMSKGAVCLGQTSLPIGGINTNAVIAAHRGYNGIPFWREIESVQVGDYVYVTNLWEKLTYQVTGIAIIYPNEIDKVLIQEGRDMLTLVTCHPYRSHGLYRYVLYCDRVENDMDESVDTSFDEVVSANENTENYIDVDDGIIFEPSQNDIDFELLVQRISICIILICAGGIVLLEIVRHKKKQ